MTFHDNAGRCRPFKDLPLCMGRWTTIIWICEEAEHQLRQGEHFVALIPLARLGVRDILGHTACLSPVWLRQSLSLKMNWTVLSILPTKQSFIFTTQLENKRGPGSGGSRL